jgi:hypothetical protein
VTSFVDAVIIDARQYFYNDFFLTAPYTSIIGSVDAPFLGGFTKPSYYMMFPEGHFGGIQTEGGFRRAAPRCKCSNFLGTTILEMH